MMMVATSIAGCGLEPEATCDAPIGECSFGLYFGSCPGDSGPVLACVGGFTGGCLWFTGGCPVGYVPSDCPADDICCHATSAGPWPFADGWSPEYTNTRQQVISDLATIGSGVVDENHPSEIAVTIDPSVPPPTEVRGTRIRCSSGAPLQICAERELAPRAGVMAPIGRTWVVRFATNDLAAEAVRLELLETLESGRLVGRLFVRDDVDSGTGGVPACEPFKPRFVSGTVRVTELAAGAHGRLRAEMADGSWVELDF
jgi:hypothetical protein